MDFAHIPVGVLSQAYERYLSRHEPTKQRKEGGYYTPRHIADLMVRASFHTLRKRDLAPTARILDPASGAGVFLLTAFRELVAEQWRATGIRPDTKALRSILYKQITGFDINESALRFAALGLYLISIELDPNPRPVSKLRFRNLRPNVLRWTGGPDASEPELGSLGASVGPEHDRQYDIVIGNPPWASSTRLEGWKTVCDRIQEIAGRRVAGCAPLPNEVLDLPFVWRAMEWGKPSAQIAFALHARILFQQGETMPQARRALFSALDVTGIINGAELRNSRVWPEISAPFCLLFAVNRTPPPGSGFRFSSPRLEGPLNRAGAWRVDVANSEIVTSAQVRERPEILKILFRGSRLDLEAYDRLSAMKLPTLDQYWRQVFGPERGRSGNGYQRLRNSSRVRSSGDGLPGADARYLHGLPEFVADRTPRIVVNPAALPRFAQDRIHDPRSRSLFRAPLLLVSESPPVSHGRIRVHVAEEDLVFNQSYHGYSAADRTHGTHLIRHLALILSSKVALWHALITSGRFGFEREVVEKFVLDKTPVIPFESLSPEQARQSDAIFSTIANETSEGAWKEADAFVARLYRLDASDIETITDTLTFNLPYSTNRTLAQAPASNAEVDAFASRLEKEIGSSTSQMDFRMSGRGAPSR